MVLRREDLLSTELTLEQQEEIITLGSDTIKRRYDVDIDSRKLLRDIGMTSLMQRSGMVFPHFEEKIPERDVQTLIREMHTRVVENQDPQTGDLPVDEVRTLYHLYMTFTADQVAQLDLRLLLNRTSKFYAIQRIENRPLRHDIE